MKLFKSSWFWFLIAWIFLAVVGLIVILAVLRLDWKIWHTVGLSVYAAVGVVGFLLLWQKNRIRVLAKGEQKDSANKFEELWKASMRADFQRLVAASTRMVVDGLKSGDDLKEKSLCWVVSSDPLKAERMLLSAGAVDVTQQRSHELSGEFSQGAAWCVCGDVVYVVLRKLPDLKVVEETERLAFLMSLLQGKGKIRPVDSALVMLPLSQDTAMLPVALRMALSCLAELSHVEFPVHVLFEGAEKLRGGADFFRMLRTCGIHELPGASLPFVRQDRLPEALDDAWLCMDSDVQEKLQALLCEAWDADVDPTGAFLFCDALKASEVAAKSALKGVCGGFVGKAVPFLRSFAFIPSSPDGSCLTEDAAARAEVSYETDTLLTAQLAFLASEPPLARLSSQQQVRSSLWATAFFVSALVVSGLVAAAAMHGFVKGGMMDAAWKVRLQKAENAEWRDSTSIHRNLGAWYDLRLLDREIRDGRPWLLAPGFYRDGQRLPQVEARLDTMTLKMVQLSFVWQERRLMAEASTIHDSLSDTKDLYANLKTYLLLTSEGWALGRDKEGDKGLAEAYLKAWAGFLGLPDGVPLPPLERTVLPPFSEDVSQRVDKGQPQWLGRADMELVNRARLLLRSSRNQSGTYARLLGAADSLQDLNADSLGFPSKEISCGQILVPKAFTRNAYGKAILPALEEMARGETDWVVGKTPGGGAVDASASLEVIQELRRRYFEDYEKVWQKVLESVSCTLPPENQKIAAALAVMGSAYAPQNPRGLLAFLKRVSDETDLTGVVAAGTNMPAVPAKAAAMVAKAQEAAAATGILNRKDDPYVVHLQQWFAPVRSLSDLASKGGFDAYLKDLGQLSGVFSQGTQGDGALQFAKEVAAGDQRNPLVHAQNEAKAKSDLLPADQRPWFNRITLQLLQQLSVKLAPQASGFLSGLYRDKILNPWQNLSKGAFPFDPYAQGEASIADVDAFFNPRTGTLSSFLKDAEGVFSPGGGSSASAGRAASEAIQKLLRIQSFFYGRNGTAWKGCQVTVTLHGDPRAKIGFRSGSQTAELSQGSAERHVTFRWPMAGQAGAGILATTQSNSFEDHRDGEWALLRLVEPHVVSATQGNVDAVWSFSDRSYAVDVSMSLRIDPASNPFREKDFFQVNLPSDLSH